MTACDPHPDDIDVVFTESQIAQRIEALADEIAASLEAPPLMETVMNGAVIFAADLARALSRRGIVIEMDFIALSSYGKGMTSTGEINLAAEARGSIAGRHVLLVDDILETGRTLKFACDYFRERGAKVVRTVVLLDKSAGRNPVIRPDHTGFECPDEFVIGYGMDQAFYWRELPFIGRMLQKISSRN